MNHSDFMKLIKYNFDDVTTVLENIKEFREWLENGEKESSIHGLKHGLCHNIRLYLIPCNLQDFLFEEWKHFSGSYGYPVPDPSKCNDPTYLYINTDNVYSGEYGKLRMDLLRHIEFTLTTAVASV